MPARRTLAAGLLAVMATGAPTWAACAHAQAAPPFQDVPARAAPHVSHRLAYAVGLLGAGLVAGSFPLSAEADRRYDRYLRETDVSRIDERFRATQRMDRLASAALLTGEGLLATAVWLRFVHQPAHARRLGLALAPGRCACELRF